MNLNDYQKKSSETAIYPGRGEYLGLAYCGLKLNGEAGEIAEEIGKALRDDGGEMTRERRDKILLELGDCLWYITQIATELGFSMATIAEANLAKLASRKARGVLGGSGSDR